MYDRPIAIKFEQRPGYFNLQFNAPCMPEDDWSDPDEMPDFQRILDLYDAEVIAFGSEEAFHDDKTAWAAYEKAAGEEHNFMLQHTEELCELVVGHTNPHWLYDAINKYHFLHREEGFDEHVKVGTHCSPFWLFDISINDERKSLGMGLKDIHLPCPPVSVQKDIIGYVYGLGQREYLCESDEMRRLNKEVNDRVAESQLKSNKPEVEVIVIDLSKNLGKN